MEEGKEYCHLCNMNLKDDENKDKQFWFTADCITRHYCSNCAKYGESIMNEFINKSSRKRAYREYYDSYDLIKLIEPEEGIHDGLTIVVKGEWISG